MKDTDMLQINRVVSDDGRYMNLLVKHPGRPDLVFDIRSHPKIANVVSPNDDNLGDRIFAIANNFIKTIHIDFHDHLWQMYNDIHEIINTLDPENLDKSIDPLVTTVERFLNKSHLEEDLIYFCESLPYPEIKVMEGHTERRTFFKRDFIELTALSIFMKLMLPMIGGVHAKLTKIYKSEVDNFLLTVVHDILEGGDFKNIYTILSDITSMTISARRSYIDKRTGNFLVAPTSVLLHSGKMSDRDLQNQVMAYLLLKRFVVYQHGQYIVDDELRTSNIAVYINDSTMRCIETSLQALHVKFKNSGEN